MDEAKDSSLDDFPRASITLNSLPWEISSTENDFSFALVRCEIREVRISLRQIIDSFLGVFFARDYTLINSKEINCSQCTCSKKHVLFHEENCENVTFHISSKKEKKNKRRLILACCRKTETFANEVCFLTGDCLSCIIRWRGIMACSYLRKQECGGRTVHARDWTSDTRNDRVVWRKCQEAKFENSSTCWLWFFLWRDKSFFIRHSM